MNLQHSETVLVIQAQNGDADSFIKLVGPHQDSLAKAMLVLSKSEANFEYVLTDLLTKIYLNLKLYKFDVEFRQWIFKKLIVGSKNLECKMTTDLECTIDLSYRRKTSLCSSRKILLNNIKSHSRELEQDRIKKALKILPWAERAALVLCDVSGFDYDDITYIMGLSIPEVSELIYHARAHLISELALKNL